MTSWKCVVPWMTAKRSVYDEIIAADGICDTVSKIQKLVKAIAMRIRNYLFGLVNRASLHIHYSVAAIH